MIQDFVIEKMSAYVIGGSTPESAAHFTRGELEAIYKGNHHSRDTSGAWRITPPPEALPIEAAMKKADGMIAEILQTCKQQMETERTGEKQPRTERIKKTGLEGLKRFTRGIT